LFYHPRFLITIPCLKKVVVTGGWCCHFWRMGRFFCEGWVFSLPEGTFSSVENDVAVSDGIIVGRRL
jgi:hypothetical protein